MDETDRPCPSEQEQGAFARTGDAMDPPVAFSRRGLHVLFILAVPSSAMWGTGIWGLLRLVG